jgi:hypothetical protein
MIPMLSELKIIGEAGEYKNTWRRSCNRRSGMIYYII